MSHRIPFWRKVDKSAGPDGCWIWLGKKSKRYYNRNGKWVRRAVVYGLVRVWGDKKRDWKPAHRIAYQLHHNVEIVSRKILVCHTCDNGLCVNPKHLFLGKHKHNTKDMMEKGRNRHNNFRKGKKHMSMEIIKRMRRLHKKGWTTAELMKKFGTSYEYTRLIVTNKVRKEK